MPNIAVINESTIYPNGQVQAMIPAFAQQWNQDLKPVWSVEDAIFVFVPRGTQPAPGAWWVVFLDNSDQADALAYHDLTNEGLPISKVFAQPVLEEGSSVSVAATHEICEMAVDPWLNCAYQDSSGVFWAAEICDPVESAQYGYEIGSVLVTDFVTPRWFSHRNPAGKIDVMRHASSAFQVLSGGYAQKFDAQKGWQQVTGAKAQLRRRVVEPAIGSRRERRTRNGALRPSASQWVRR